VAARATAKFAVIDDFPTPPFPEAIMRTGVWVGIEVEGALAWAMVASRASSVRLRRCVQDAHDEIDRVNVLEGQRGLFDVAFDLAP